MGSPKEYQDLWESLSKNKIMKIIIIGITGAISGFLILLILATSFKICTGQHVKLWGLEINDDVKTNAKKQPPVLSQNPSVTPIRNQSKPTQEYSTPKKAE